MEKNFEDTVITGNNTYEVEKLIKQEHPDYPDYSGSYKKKLWDFYSQLYKLQQNFDELSKFDEITQLSQLSITPKLSFPVSGTVSSGEVLLTFRSNHSHTKESVEPIFLDLRKKLSYMYPGLKFVFSVEWLGEGLQL